MRKRVVNRKAAWLLIILGLFLSYSLDLECVVAPDSGCQTLCQDSGDDLCREPLMGLTAPVALPFRTYVFQRFSVPVGRHQYAPNSDDPVPLDPGQKVPIGLRAPPHHSRV